MFKMRLILILLFASGCVLGNSRSSKFRTQNLLNETKVEENRRAPKLFSLFNIVQFRNEACQTTETLTSSDNNRNGTCYSTTECADKGGQSKGSCASGFGVCCLFLVSDSGSTVVQNNTYIQSPGGGGPTNSEIQTTYTYSVDKCSSEVCFLRLDFETFSLMGVGGTSEENEGVCIDTFKVATFGQQIPVICGENSGQHIYVEFGENDSLGISINLDVQGTGSPAASRQWDIKAGQIECGNAGSAPPAGCLQYLTGLTGRITTFNYNDANDNHLNNQQYSVCIRPEYGFCCVQYQVCPDGVFYLSPDLTGAMTDDNCVADENGNLQPHDYLAIPNSAATCNPTGAASAATDSRYCGPFLNNVNGAMANAPVCDCTPPFTVDIYTDGLPDTGILNGINTDTLPSRGACLDYTQIPC